MLKESFCYGTGDTELHVSSYWGAFRAAVGSFDSVYQFKKSVRKWCLERFNMALLHQRCDVQEEERELERFSVPAEHFFDERLHLFFDGQELEDTYSLRSCGIQSGSRLHLFISWPRDHLTITIEMPLGNHVILVAQAKNTVEQVKSALLYKVYDWHYQSAPMDWQSTLYLDGTALSDDRSLQIYGIQTSSRLRFCICSNPQLHIDELVLATGGIRMDLQPHNGVVVHLLQIRVENVEKVVDVDGQCLAHTFQRWIHKRIGITPREQCFTHFGSDIVVFDRPKIGFVALWRKAHLATIQRALRGYASFHAVSEYQACLKSVLFSSAGIHGWSSYAGGRVVLVEHDIQSRLLRIDLEREFSEMKRRDEIIRETKFSEMKRCHDAALDSRPRCKYDAQKSKSLSSSTIAFCSGHQVSLMPGKATSLDAKVEKILCNQGLIKTHGLPPIAERDATGLCAYFCMKSIYRRFSPNERSDQDLGDLIKEAVQYVAMACMGDAAVVGLLPKSALVLCCQHVTTTKKRQLALSDLEFTSCMVGDRPHQQKLLSGNIRWLLAEHVGLALEVLNQYLQVPNESIGKVIYVTELEKPSFCLELAKEKRWYIIADGQHYVALLPHESHLKCHSAPEHRPRNASQSQQSCNSTLAWVLKFKHRDEVYRTRLDNTLCGKVQFQEIELLIQRTLGLAKEDIKAAYVDAAGDKCVLCEASFTDFLASGKQESDDLMILQFCVWNQSSLKSTSALEHRSSLTNTSALEQVAECGSQVEQKGTFALAWVLKLSHRGEIYRVRLEKPPRSKVHYKEVVSVIEQTLGLAKQDIKATYNDAANDACVLCAASFTDFMASANRESEHTTTLQLYVSGQAGSSELRYEEAVRNLLVPGLSSVGRTEGFPVVGSRASSICSSTWMLLDDGMLDVTMDTDRNPQTKEYRCYLPNTAFRSADGNLVLVQNLNLSIQLLTSTGEMARVITLQLYPKSKNALVEIVTNRGSFKCSAGTRIAVPADDGEPRWSCRAEEIQVGDLVFVGGWKKVEKVACREEGAQLYMVKFYPDEPLETFLLPQSGFLTLGEEHSELDVPPHGNRITELELMMARFNEEDLLRAMPTEYGD